MTAAPAKNRIRIFELACLYWKRRRCNVSYQKSYFKDLPSVQLAEAQGPEAVRALVESQAAFKMKLAQDASTLAKTNIEGQMGLIDQHNVLRLSLPAGLTLSCLLL
jgi:hypothetical protein